MTRIAPMITAVVLIVGCSPSATASPSDPPASSMWPASEAPSIASTPAPTPSGSPPPASSQEPIALPLGPDVIAEVVTTDLVMRTAPEVSPESTIYPGRLGPGDRVYLVDGPVSADGFEWYLGSPYEARVNKEADATSQVWVRFGWVAAADKTGEAWIIPIEADCLPDATVENLAELPFELRLACYGKEPISLEGNVTCADFGPPIPTPKPAWLTWDACHIVPSDAPPYDYLGGSQQFIPIHYPPEDERLTGALSITGHFDDQRSIQCRQFIPTPEGDVYSQDLHHRDQQLRCRASFVVDRAEPIEP